MKTYKIPHTDLPVPRIGHGCNQSLGSDQGPYDHGIFARTSAVVHTAIDTGNNLFDMAAMHSDEKGEIVFGEILERSPSLRDEVITQARCGAVYNPQWKRTGEPAFIFDCSREGILESEDGSLRRLGSDRIDILLLFTQAPAVGIVISPDTSTELHYCENQSCRNGGNNALST